MRSVGLHNPAPGSGSVPGHPRPHKAAPIGHDEVLLWVANLSGTAAELAHSASTLSPDERARAERFHAQRDRQRYVRGRGILRCILAECLQTPPQSFRFSYGPEGKPGLAGGRPEFNLAHAHDLAVYAVARNEVGIDLEHMDPQFDFAAVLETAATSRERDRFGSLSPELRAREFFAWWTRKEAYVKALGRGLSIPPDSFEVPISPAKPDVVVAMEDGLWKLETLVPAVGYVATIATRGAGWKRRFP